MTEGNYKYELMVILSLDNGLDAAKKLYEATKKQISKHGEIFFEDVWGEKDLAYPMNKHEKGFYAVLNFSFEPAEIKEFETGLRLDPDVIRHLIVKIPMKYEPKTLAQLAEAKEKQVEAEEKETAKK